MILRTHIPNAATISHFAQVTGPRREVVLQIVKSIRGGWHLSLKVGKLRYYTGDCGSEAFALKHANLCNPHLDVLAKCREASVETTAESILAGDYIGQS